MSLHTIMTIMHLVIILIIAIKAYKKADTTQNFSKIYWIFLLPRIILATVVIILLETLIEKTFFA